MNLSIAVREKGSHEISQLKIEGLMRLNLNLGSRDDLEPISIALTEEAFEEFWSRAESKISVLEIHGEEFYLSPYFWHLFDFYGDLAENQKICFRLRTNLRIPESILDWLILKTHYIKDFQLLLEGDVQFENLEKILKWGRISALLLGQDEYFNEPVLQNAMKYYRPGFCRQVEQ